MWLHMPDVSHCFDNWTNVELDHVSYSDVLILMYVMHILHTGNHHYSTQICFLEVLFVDIVVYYTIAKNCKHEYTIGRKIYGFHGKTSLMVEQNSRIMPIQRVPNQDRL